MTPGAGQRGDHARQRLAEVLAEGRRQRQLEARQRVDDHAAGAQAADLAACSSSTISSIDRSGARVSTRPTWPLSIRSASAAVARPVRALLEGGDDAGLAAARALGQEGGGQDALARPRGAGDQQRVAARQAAAQHLVEARHAHRAGARRSGAATARGAAAGTHARRREHLDAGAARCGRCAGPGSVGLAAHLHDLHLAHHRVALHALAQPDQPVGDGEHRVGRRSR